jgi:hypothetical protein
MLTNDVIEYVHEFDKIHRQINELFIDKMVKENQYA